MLSIGTNPAFNCLPIFILLELLEEQSILFRLARFSKPTENIKKTQKEATAEQTVSPKKINSWKSIQYLQHPSQLLVGQRRCSGRRTAIGRACGRRLLVINRKQSERTNDFFKVGFIAYGQIPSSNNLPEKELAPKPVKKPPFHSAKKQIKIKIEPSAHRAQWRSRKRAGI